MGWQRAKTAQTCPLTKGQTDSTDNSVVEKVIPFDIIVMQTHLHGVTKKFGVDNSDKSERIFKIHNVFSPYRLP